MLSNKLFLNHKNESFFHKIDLSSRENLCPGKYLFGKKSIREIFILIFREKVHSGFLRSGNLRSASETCDVAIH